MLEVKNVNRKLENYEEVVELMKTAFPPEEQIPLWMLRLLSFIRKTEFTAYYDSGIFAGISYTGTDEKMVFVVFLAVNPNIRSKGYGTAILNHIKKRTKEKQLP